MFTFTMQLQQILTGQWRYVIYLNGEEYYASGRLFAKRATAEKHGKLQLSRASN